MKDTYSTENTYSEKELLMLRHFGYADLVDVKSVSAPMLYRMMMEKAFVDNDQTPFAESLRRCMIAFQKGPTPYRGTKEWDDLIQTETRGMRMHNFRSDYRRGEKCPCGLDFGSHFGHTL